MSPDFLAACAFVEWEAEHPTAPGPVRAMVRDEHAEGHADFDWWYAALTDHVRF